MIMHYLAVGLRVLDLAFGSLTLPSACLLSYLVACLRSLIVELVSFVVLVLLVICRVLLTIALLRIALTTLFVKFLAWIRR